MVEGDIFNTLKGLVGNRGYPDVAPSGAVKPYMVYQQVGGEAPTFLERALEFEVRRQIEVNEGGGKVV